MSYRRRKFIGVRASQNGTGTVNTLSNGTPAAFSFNTTLYDTSPAGNMHDNVTNNSRLVAKVEGLYAVWGNARWAINGTGQRTILIKLNGTTTYAQTYSICSATNFQYQNVCTLLYMVVGDYVELFGYQTSGGNLSTQNTQETNFGLSLLASSAGLAGSGQYPLDGATVSLSANQSCATGGFVALLFDNVVQQGGAISYSSVTGNFTCKTSGAWLAMGSAGFAGSASLTRRAIGLSVNGPASSNEMVNTMTASANSNASQVSFGAVYYALAAGNFFNISTFQDTGGVLDTLGGTTFGSVYYLGE